MFKNLQSNHAEYRKHFWEFLKTRLAPLFGKAFV
jgi:hypothetical protein